MFKVCAICGSLIVRGWDCGKTHGMFDHGRETSVSSEFQKGISQAQPHSHGPRDWTARGDRLMSLVAQLRLTIVRAFSVRALSLLIGGRGIAVAIEWLSCTSPSIPIGSAVYHLNQDYIIGRGT
jgi:hypothetical protein